MSLAVRTSAAFLALALAATVLLYSSGALGLLYSWLASISAVAFLAFGYDKAVAGSGRTRIPENTLLLLALVGGTVGALLGMVVFRHKTSKRSFWGRLVVLIVIQAVGVLLIYSGLRPLL